MRLAAPKRILLAGTALVPLLLAGGGVDAARRSVDPDWPCQQVKVEELSVGSFWNGPEVDPATAEWRQDAAVAALAPALAQRRLPMEQAVQQIADFGKAAEGQRQHRMQLLFAGVFDVLNRERSTVIAGLDRFGRRQKALATSLRQEAEDLQAAQAATPQDSTKVADLTQHLQWDQQFFETRQQSLQFACDVPTAIEQRLYGLAKAIQSNLE